MGVIVKVITCPVTVSTCITGVGDQELEDDDEFGVNSDVDGVEEVVIGGVEVDEV